MPARRRRNERRAKMGIVLNTNWLKKKKGQNPDTPDEIDEGMMCDNLNFTSAEAYKMLRTKIGLSIPNKTEDESGLKRAKIIGMTSSIKGEGKSTTSINLAYTIAEAGYKVCLLEADLRLPNIARRLSLNAPKGLSNLLAGQCKPDDVIKSYTSEKKVRFMVLTGGDPSPAPSELLASDLMKKLMDKLSTLFDYIIVDLPPVTVVTDPLIVADLLDGILLVVRRGYADRIKLQEAIHNFEFSNTKLLGIVMTSDHAASGSTKYGRYGKYGNSYYKSQEKGPVPQHATAHKTTNKKK